MTIAEAQLQAYVLGLVRKALPYEPAESFCVEKWLKIRLGHQEHEEDGTANWEANGRADLVVYHRDRPLAVFELKREDKTLTEQDVLQARSYAVAMLDRPPLVIVSNGKETWTRQSIDGMTLDPEVEGAAFVENLFSNIAMLAAANNSWAIEVLMGPEIAVWVEAVRRRTDEMIRRMTGEVGDMRKPFIHDMLFRRSATSEILTLLDEGARAVVVEGAPLAGKSNVFRDLAHECRSSPDWAILMVNAAPHGPGLFQRLANVLGDALEWSLSADDVRTWLRRMSQSSRRPALVIAIDGLRPETEVASDIEELVDNTFGEGLRLVAAVDRADDILLDPRGRGETGVASIAHVVEVGTLVAEEFERVKEELSSKRILFYGGAELSQEYRTAWILRLVLVGGLAPDTEEYVAVIPATMGLKTMRVVRDRLKEVGEVARLHRLVARDALADDKMPDAELALSQANAFVVRRDALSCAGGAAARTLEQQGWVTFHRHTHGEDILVFRAPEFMMSELAHELAQLLDNLIDDNVDEAAAQLIFHSQRFFLGDLIGAQAVVDLAANRKFLPLDMLKSLMNSPPGAESMAGKWIGIAREDGEIVNLRFDERGRFALADAKGNPITPFKALDPDEDLPVMYSDMTPWLILSQLAQLPAVIGEGTKKRFDIEIILLVGRSGFPLLRGDLSLEMGHTVQSLGAAGSVLSLEHSLAEPITTAIHKLFAEEWRDLGPFFKRVEQANSLPLTARVHNALLSLRNSADRDLDRWAFETLEKIILPLLREQVGR